MYYRTIMTLVVLLSLPTLALAADPMVYFIEPANGAVVSNPVKVVFGLSGMGVAPAGVQYDNTGHHHLIIDAGLPENLKAPILKDQHYRHFGDGQTETIIELSPGPHTLQLLLGNYLHIPHDPPVKSEKITITVKER